MKKIFSYLWSSSNGSEYNEVTLDKILSDNDKIKSYIDPNYKNVILIYYKSGAGGLFLANCLCLSEKVYTLYNKLDDKIKFLYECLEKQSLFWNDIYLVPPIIEYDCPEHIHNNRYTLIFDHDPKKIKMHLKHWNYLNIIYFNNSDLFCRVRRLLKNYYNELIEYSCEYVKMSNKYKIPNTIKEYKKLTIDEKNKLINFYNDNQKIYSFSFLKNKKLFYVWDTNWYFSEEDTVTHVKELYDNLNLPDFNEPVIRNYYRKWVQTLDKLKKEKVPKNLNLIIKNKDKCDKSMAIHEEKTPI